MKNAGMPGASPVSMGWMMRALARAPSPGAAHTRPLTSPSRVSQSFSPRPRAGRVHPPPVVATQAWPIRHVPPASRTAARTGPDCCIFTRKPR